MYCDMTTLTTTVFQREGVSASSGRRRRTCCRRGVCQCRLWNGMQTVAGASCIWVSGRRVGPRAS